MPPEKMQRECLALVVPNQSLLYAFRVVMRGVYLRLHVTSNASITTTGLNTAKTTASGNAHSISIDQKSRDFLVEWIVSQRDSGLKSFTKNTPMKEFEALPK